MKQEFEIKHCGECVGIASVTSVGLYFDIICKCTIREGFVRIIADCSKRRENIGICVPINGEMVLHTKIPQKRLETLLGFEAICEMPTQWVPIVEGEPISCLDKIQDAKLQYCAGKPGLIIQQARPYKNP